MTHVESKHRNGYRGGASKEAQFDQAEWTDAGASLDRRLLVALVSGGLAFAEVMSACPDPIVVTWKPASAEK